MTPIKTNNQTAVDSIFKNTFDSFEAYQLKQISLVQFFSNLLDHYKQAKQIEKEQLNIARLDGINLANKKYGNK